MHLALPPLTAQGKCGGVSEEQEVGIKSLSRETNRGRKKVAPNPVAIVKGPFDNDSQEGLLNNGLLPGNCQLERYRFLMRMANLYRMPPMCLTQS